MVKFELMNFKLNGNNQVAMAVVGMKRSFAFTRHSNTTGGITQEYQTKRLCVEQRLDPSSACRDWNTVQMECETYMTRPDAPEGCPSIDKSSMVSLNNNNTMVLSSQFSQGQSVCLRCQAGEAGHISHIGR